MTPYDSTPAQVAGKEGKVSGSHYVGYAAPTRQQLLDAAQHLRCDKRDEAAHAVLSATEELQELRRIREVLIQLKTCDEHDMDRLYFELLALVPEVA